MNESNSYFVGTTVSLTVIVTAVGSANPEDATSVILDALTSGTDTGTVPNASFTHVSTGTYVLELDTTDMAPGVWTWRAKATNSQGITFAEDTFTLRARTGTVTVAP